MTSQDFPVDYSDGITVVSNGTNSITIDSEDLSKAYTFDRDVLLYCAGSWDGSWTETSSFKWIMGRPVFYIDYYDVIYPES